MRFLAKLISLIFHPIFMPTFGVLIVSYLPTQFVGGVFGKGVTDQQSFVLLMMMVLFTILFPLCHLTLLYLGKHIQSIHLETRKERIPVFVGTLILYVSAYLFMSIKGGNYIPTVYYSLMLGGITTLVLAIAITIKWKISIHAIGISGVAGSLVAVNELLSEHWLYHHPNYKLSEIMPWLVIYIVILMGIVGSARLALKAHSINQVLAGYAIGFVTLYVFVRYGVKL